MNDAFCAVVMMISIDFCSIKNVLKDKNTYRNNTYREEEYSYIKNNAHPFNEDM